MGGTGWCLISAKQSGRPAPCNYVITIMHNACEVDNYKSTVCLAASQEITGRDG